MRVSINRESCAGSGVCVSMLPSIFDQDDEGTAAIKRQPSGREEPDRVRRAGDQCPTSSIVIDEAAASAG